MAIVKWAKGIDFVSGLLSKRPKKGTPHSEHSNALLATHRVAATTNPDCTRIYMVGEYNRSTPVGANETKARTRFAAVAAAVNTRKNDLMQMTTDQANFLAQKDQAGGKKTYKAYLWKICGDAYDAEHNG
ncbi:MAG: hypothetical protein K6F10_03920 [Paludibacteraceae bacterium]|nr:hypothetical protein [Paludibacteraceae bacterium]